MNQLERWGVCEVVRDGLPVRVLPLRLDRAPTLNYGELLRWICCEPISARAARRIARQRSAMIARWSGGHSPWLETYCPLPAGDYCRPVRRIWPDGRVDCFPSIAAAARAARRDRMVVKKWIVNGCSDYAGCRWEAIGGPVARNREVHGSQRVLGKRVFS